MQIRKVLNEKCEEWLLVISFLLMVVLVLAQVFSRFVFSLPVGWSVELSRYLLVWIAWISASYTIKHNEHIRVELVKNVLSEGKQKVLDLLSLIVFFAFASFLAVMGTILVLDVQVTGQLSSSLDMPMWIVYLAIPVAGALMCIRLFQQAVMIIKH